MKTDAHLNSLGMAGDYNKNSSPQRVALGHTFAVLEQVVDSVCQKISFVPEHAFTIADYGSSHGGNSLKPMSIIIEAVRGRTSPNQSIAIYHTDLPHNDYNTLFRTLHESEDSYLLKYAGSAHVLTFATATPFFQQILPTSSVHFGFSSSAAHWLSCFPCEADHLYTVAAPEPVRNLWREQAAVDWDMFLRARSVELVPGGMMVLANLFMEENGDYTTKELGMVMDKVISEMVMKNMVEPAAAHKFSHPSYFRTHKEYTSPLPKFGLSLCTSFSRHIPNPIYLECERDNNWSGFGKAMVEWAKQWAHVALLRVVSYLEEPTRTEVCDYFYNRVAEEVDLKPHDHQILMVMLYLVVEKNFLPAVAQI